MPRIALRIALNQADQRAKVVARQVSVTYDDWPFSPNPLAERSDRNAHGGKRILAIGRTVVRNNDRPITRLQGNPPRRVLKHWYCHAAAGGWNSRMPTV